MNPLNPLNSFDPRDIADDGVRYPSSDGRPIAEGDVHRIEMLEYGLDVLRDYFHERDDVYISSNNFLYYRRGDPETRVSPDLYVVFGVSKGSRDRYLLWEEGPAPSFVLEVTSMMTLPEDLGEKMEIYRDELGVPEYFIFDPREEWLPGNLRGYDLLDRNVGRIAPLPSGRLPSRTLGLELGVSGGHIRFFRPGEPEPLDTRDESIARSRESIRLSQNRIRIYEAERRGAERAAAERSRSAPRSQARST